MSKRTVYIQSRNHFDNIWRRCWDRPFEYGGQLYGSYVTVERAVIDEWLATARAHGEFAFEVESTRVLRRYIEDHPGSKAVFKRLWDQGRFDTPASGEVIPDANMPRGETLVRNLAEGIWWTEETLGHRPRVGFHSDGFGSCAQFPQIFTGCGLKWIAALSYKFPTGRYWRGLDGSVVYIGTFPGRGACDFVKYPPCEKCRGRGCQACGGHGLNFSRRLQPGVWFDELDAPVGLLMFTGEEVLPPAGLAKAVAEHRSDVEYRFGIIEGLLPHLKKELAACARPPRDQVAPEPDGNPTMSGVLVGRIELKRRHRFVEAVLTAAEMRAALRGSEATRVPADLPRAQEGVEAGSRILPWERNARPGKGPVPPLRHLWRDVALGAFHDALTATHVDPAYTELMELYDHVEDACAAHLRAARNPAKKALGLFNSTSKTGGVREVWPLLSLPEGPLALRVNGVELPVIERTRSAEGTERLWVDLPDLPVASLTAVEVVRTPRRQTADAVETGAIVRWSGAQVAVEADDKGIVHLKHNGKTCLRRGEWGVGELVSERDVGDPWVTREKDRQRFGCNAFASRTSALATDTGLELVYSGSGVAGEATYAKHDPMQLVLDWTQRWRFYRDREYVDLRTEIEWSSYNRRIRLAFPTGWPTDTMWTEVPFGVLRRERYEMDMKRWSDANGDWPAIGWAGVEHGGMGLAVANRGTPSYRCEDGTIFISVLRSPTFPHCLDDGVYGYDAPVYDGMRDAGRHVFEHRLLPYRGRWVEAGVVEAAEAFNVPVPLTPGGGMGAWLSGIPEGVVLSAVKPARSGGGLIVRLVEMNGKARKFALRIARPCSAVYETNLLEDAQGKLPFSGGAALLRMKPWQIRTLLFTDRRK